ncbi:MAG: NAD+ synthase [Actinomycetes bacterium]
MPQLRIALAQVNPTVGDLEGNTELVLRWARHAAEQGAHLVAFPEMVLTGYPAEDLVLRPTFVDASRQALDEVARRLDAEGLGDLAVILGYVDRSPLPSNRMGWSDGAPQNAAALVHGGRVAARYAKHHLPNYGVFDEIRYFVPGDRLPVVRLHGVDVAMAICEDLWQEGGPVALARDTRAGLFVVLNGSPYEQHKDDTRLELVEIRAAQSDSTLAYVNLVGGQDELVYDGDSLVVTPDGTLLARATQFEEACLVCDLDLPLGPRDEEPGSVRVDAHDGTRVTVERIVLSEQPLAAYTPRVAEVAPRLDDHAEVYAALLTGTRDYVAKNGFRSVVLGLSGGIDSALTATIAVDAIGADRVHTVALPSRHSSDHAREDADELAARQGTRHTTVPIDDVVDAFEGTLTLHGVASENLQARVRGMLLMALSNEHGHLVLTTGNKSELATGYSTLYGDSAGGYGPIKDVPKTQVWDLARWRNTQAAQQGETPPIPERSIEKPPSAELSPGQLDSDSLPDYEVLDRLLDDYVEQDMGFEGLLEAGHDPEVVEQVLRLVDAAEYKRRQYPPGPKISPRNFGRDRRLPITSKWQEKASRVLQD